MSFTEKKEGDADLNDSNSDKRISEGLAASHSGNRRGSLEQIRDK